MQVGLLWYDIQSNTKKRKRIWHQWFIWKSALHNWDSFGVFRLSIEACAAHKTPWDHTTFPVMPAFSYKYRPGGHVVLAQVISSSKSLLLSTSIFLLSRFQSIHHHVDLRQLRLRWQEPVRVSNRLAIPSPRFLFCVFFVLKLGCCLRFFCWSFIMEERIPWRRGKSVHFLGSPLF